jgi:hypothetical protein
MELKYLPKEISKEQNLLSLQKIGLNLTSTMNEIVTNTLKKQEQEKKWKEKMKI